MIYEIRRLFSSRLMLVCIVLLMGFLAVFVMNAHKAKSVLPEYNRLLDDISQTDGDIDAKIELLRQKSEWLNQQVFEKGDAAGSTAGEYGTNLIGDMILFSKANTDMQQWYKDFPENRKSIVINSVYNIEDEKAKANPDKTIIEMNELSIEKYNRKIEMPLRNAGDLFNTLYHFDNTVWDYAMIVFVIMLTVRLFLLDRSVGAYQVLYSSVVRKRRLFVDQYLAVWTVSTVILFVTSICQIICGALFFGVGSLSLPIQMTKYFEFCPYLITVGEYYIIKLGCKLLFYTALISVTALLSISIKKAAIAMPLSAILSIVPLVIITFYFTHTTGDNVNALSQHYQIYKLLQLFVPQALLNIKTYFIGFDYVNAGILLPRITVCILATAVIAVICFVISAHKFAKPRG